MIIEQNVNGKYFGSYGHVREQLGAVVTAPPMYHSIGVICGTLEENCVSLCDDRVSGRGQEGGWGWWEG